MAARIITTEVQALMDGLACKNDVVVDLAIEQANMLVNEELVGKVPALSDSRLRMIELNLAAHFCVVAIERGGLTSREMGDSREDYVDMSGQVKLSSTRFGQQAVSLDPTGGLASLDSPKGKAEFRVLGGNTSNGFF